VTLIVVPTSTASASSKPLSATSTAAARRIRLGLRLVDFQGATSKVGPVQCRNSLIGFAGIGHLDKSKAAGSAGFAVRDNTDALDCAVRLKQSAKLWLGSAMG
jgi:hypothetical protein